MKEKDRGPSHRELSNEFQVSVILVSKIVERKYDHIDDYASNENKKMRRKIKDHTGQQINDHV